jgi:L-ascorbate metabolism protein UlaG (beta-lactamase superfamily)
MTLLPAFLLLAVFSLNTLIAQQASPLVIEPYFYAYPLSSYIDQNGPDSIGVERQRRISIADAMDQVFHVPISTAYHPLASPVLGPLISEFHRHRTWIAIGRMHSRASPAQGVRAYKFYSSGWFVEGAGMRFCVDYTDGPFEAAPGVQHLRPILPVQIQALARMSDAYFITHVHPDHTSYALMTAMLQLGKPIYAPLQVRTLAMLGGVVNAQNIVVPSANQAQSHGALSFKVFAGMQWGAFLDAPINHVGDPYSPINAENYSYLFKLAGVTLFHGGDNNSWSILSWMQQHAVGDWSVDVALNLGYWAADLMNVMNPTQRLLSHDMEFSHRGPAFLHLNMSPTINLSRRALFWGESISIQ